jgi:hypothetical protein
MAVPLAGAVGVRRGVSVVKCPVGRSHVVVADAQAQVYEGPLVGEGGPLPESSVFYGCAYGRGKRYELGLPPETGAGSPGGTSGSRLYTLAGPIVAFERYSTTELEPASRYVEEIVVRDLRNGRVLHRLPTGIPTMPPKNGDVGIGGATAIVVKADGAVAWIVAVNGAAVEYQVHAFDKTGNHLLASGSEIAPSSLALTGSTLYWLQGGKPMSATLN